MPKIDTDSSRKELSARVQLLMFLRVGFVSLLFGAAIVIQVRETRAYFGEILNALYLIIAAFYLLTFIYIIALKHIRHISRFAFVQIFLDTILITVIIYVTGGIESIFPFLYILNIISAGIMIYRRGAMIIASLAAIMYGALLDLNFYGLIVPMGTGYAYFPEHTSADVFYRILVNVAAFYLVAYLSSFLSSQIQKSRAELREKQKDLESLEILKENIIQSVSSGLVALDMQGRIMVFNKEAGRIFGVDSDFALQKKADGFLPFLSSYVAGKELNNPAQFSYKRKDGQKIDLLLNVSALKEPNGNERGKILILQDTTHLKKMEEEVKRMENLAMLGEMAASIAHEIRNPLASIGGSIQFLEGSLSEKDPQLKKRLMNIVTREVDRLNNLVNDFLQFARPKPPVQEEVDLNQLITDTLYMFKNSQSCPDNLETNFDFFGPSKIKSDPQQIKQVIWNLLLNACEAMPSGGLLSVRTSKTRVLDHNGRLIGSVKVTMKDNGPGIDPSVIHDMFSPFSTTKKRGSGLGLAIVKRIVEGLGGMVSAQNCAEGGANIDLFFPFSEKQTLPDQD